MKNKRAIINPTFSMEKLNVEMRKNLPTDASNENEINRYRIEIDYIRILRTVDPSRIDFVLISYWKSISQWRVVHSADT